MEEKEKRADARRERVKIFSSAKSNIKKRIILSVLLALGFLAIISLGKSVLIGFIIVLSILVFSEILRVLLRIKRRKAPGQTSATRQARNGKNIKMNGRKSNKSKSKSRNSQKINSNEQIANEDRKNDLKIENNEEMSNRRLDDKKSSCSTDNVCSNLRTGDSKTSNSDSEPVKGNILPVSFFWCCFCCISFLKYGRLLFPSRALLINKIFIPVQFIWIWWFIILLRGRSYRMKIFYLSIVVVSIVGLLECTQSAINNVNRGIYWFVFPCVLVGVNDTFAYLVGKTLGHTQLIQLSPNKTVEGFLGGGIFTVILSFPISKIIRMAVSEDVKTSNIETAVFGMIASIIAPVGGIIASGYKRAFKAKHFSTLLPGHGGVSDRIDCQLIMQLAIDLYLIGAVRKRTVTGFVVEIESHLTRKETLDLANLLIENCKNTKINEIF
ncbi:phosphatidate cytidylyltransferase [Nematocida minor]|uniref:phosphatidate cytidylyltransferase n=1 Tax=Nematocida minor TaxID=1912983 RepID=UPI00221F3D85|nr:phosphatidate cytidylyltransferase [Nematocida minor]KAI5189208.1 phosphatidate cytidylyltransferase [Nematocida minor]